MNLTELAKKYESDKGEDTDQYVGNGYTETYEKFLQPLKDKHLNLLEIGLCLAPTYAKKGKLNKDAPTSLKIWVDYFQNANIYGFDIMDFSFIDYPRTKIFRGDQGDPESLQEFMKTYPVEFDIIVDDGSHISHHQQKSLEYLFPKLKSGGYYFIEDLYIHFERDNVETGIRTVDLLRKWRDGEWVNYGMDEDKFNYLKENISSIELFVKNDRLAVIKKK